MAIVGMRVSCFIYDNRWLRCKNRITFAEKILFCSPCQRNCRNVVCPRVFLGGILLVLGCKTFKENSKTKRDKTGTFAFVYRINCDRDFPLDLSFGKKLVVFNRSSSPSLVLLCFRQSCVYRFSVDKNKTQDHKIYNIYNICSCKYFLYGYDVLRSKPSFVGNCF